VYYKHIKTLQLLELRSKLWHQSVNVINNTRVIIYNFLELSIMINVNVYSAGHWPATTTITAI